MQIVFVQSLWTAAKCLAGQCPVKTVCVSLQQQRCLLLLDNSNNNNGGQGGLLDVAETRAQLNVCLPRQL
jgi:hypothetical protein